MLNLTPKSARDRRNVVAKTRPKPSRQNLGRRGTAMAQRNHLERAGRPRTASRPKNREDARRLVERPD